MIRRRAPQYSSLTSLLDVLFILVFASLAQAAGAVHEARAAGKKQAADVPADAGVPVDAQVDAGARIPAALGPDGGESVAAEDTRVRERAVAALQRDLRNRDAIIARVAKRGVLTSIDVEEDGGTRRIHVGVPLIEQVADPDVGATYLGDEAPPLRLCSVVRRQLGRADLGGDLVVIVPEVPLSDLTVALVRGLRQDQERCMSENGIGVIVDPGKATGTPP